ncbi:hypothetical protein N7532_007548 [Penicillium argentinense]|uniref:BZIP domain-containing protein n=1 Tax=Penicillium argentinense TaxID=1131581 RepID=A0A9W9F865_9EURO|nr:uncharacterized protein N7532_007548 [Penicillium argentinense]KAJ5095257.1 hypothetical protein N7532_007548 [Penicillium argentinense]
MAGYNGRRAPNFSQYLDDLNAIPSPYDQALQQQQQTFNQDEELALFTNTEFFDFDKFTDLSLPTFDSMDDKTGLGETDQSTQNADMKFLEFLNDGLNGMTEYQPEFSGVNSQQLPVQNQQFSVPAVPAANPAPAPAPALAAAPVAAPQVAPTPAPSAVSPSTSAAGPKRKHTQKSTQASAEEAARNAAEEDKRRRNTAASARFRVKKKMREQALEKSLKETNDKNDALEARVSQLELENHWLRGLIMEKNGTEERNEQSEKAISDMFKSFLASQKAESSTSESKHGVGTFA